MTDSLLFARSSGNKARTSKVSALDLLYAQQNSSFELTPEFADSSLILMPQYFNQLASKSLYSKKIQGKQGKKGKKLSRSAKKTIAQKHLAAVNQLESTQEHMPLFAGIREDYLNLPINGQTWLFAPEMVGTGQSVLSGFDVHINCEPQDKREISVVSKSLDELVSEIEIIAAPNSQPQVESVNHSQSNAKTNEPAKTNDMDDPSLILQPQNFSLPLEASFIEAEVKVDVQPTPEPHELGDLFAGLHDEVFKNVPDQHVQVKVEQISDSSTNQEALGDNNSKKQIRKTSRKPKAESELSVAMPLLHEIEEKDEFVNAKNILKPQSQTEYAKMMAEKAAQAKLLAEQQAAAAAEEEQYDPLQYCQMLIKEDPSRPSRLVQGDTAQENPLQKANNVANKVDANQQLPSTVFTRLSKQLYVMPYQTLHAHLYLVCAVWLQPYLPTRFIQGNAVANSELFRKLVQYWILWRLVLKTAF